MRKENIVSEISDFPYIEGSNGFPENLKPFNPEDEDIPDDFFMVLSGKRRAGKSFFLRWFLSFPRWRSSFDFVYCASRTDFNGFWQRILGKEFVVHAWDTPFIPGRLAMGKYLAEKLLINQVQTAEKRMKEAGVEFPETDEGIGQYCDKVLLIIDDCISDESFHGDEVIKTLATAGRHFKLAVAVTTQHHTGIHPQLRINVDMSVIFEQEAEMARENTYKDYLAVLRDKELAGDYLDKYTEKYGCLVVINSKKTRIAQDKIFKCLAKEVPEYELGGNIQKEINEKSKQKSQSNYGHHSSNSGCGRGHGFRNIVGHSRKLSRRSPYSLGVISELMAAPGEGHSPIESERIDY